MAAKGPGGRPPKYNLAMIDRAREYIANHEAYGDPIPCIAGLAAELGVVRETCRDWGNDPEKPEFSVIMHELAQKQERKLLAGGLRGTFNSTVTKLILSKHGYSEKVDVDNTSSDGTMRPIFNTYYEPRKG